MCEYKEAVWCLLMAIYLINASNSRVVDRWLRNFLYGLSLSMVGLAIFCVI